jgi:hypothetical protein
MSHPALIAMIPVVQKFANETKNWNMPFPSLFTRLQEKTLGRVIRGDWTKQQLIEEANKRADREGELSRKEWDDFLAAVEEAVDEEGNPLYLQFSIPIVA